MASDHDDITSGWLNDAAKGFLSQHHDVDARTLTVVPGMTVSIASPKRLLAMKILAARVDRDEDDIVTLCDIIGIQSVQEALDIADAEYGSLLQPKSKFIAIELLQDRLPMTKPLSVIPERTQEG